MECILHRQQRRQPLTKREGSFFSISSTVSNTDGGELMPGSCTCIFMCYSNLHGLMTCVLSGRRWLKQCHYSQISTSCSCNDVISTIFLAGLWVGRSSLLSPRVDVGFHGLTNIRARFLLAFFKFTGGVIDHTTNLCYFPFLLVFVRFSATRRKGRVIWQKN